MLYIYPFRPAIFLEFRDFAEVARVPDDVYEVLILRFANPKVTPKNGWKNSHDALIMAAKIIKKLKDVKRVVSLLAN